MDLTMVIIIAVTSVLTGHIIGYVFGQKSVHELNRREVKEKVHKFFKNGGGKLHGKYYSVKETTKKGSK